MTAFILAHQLATLAVAIVFAILGATLIALALRFGQREADERAAAYVAGLGPDEVAEILAGRPS